MSRKHLTEALAGVPLFSRCSTRDLKAIARHTEILTVEGGSDIVRQGDDGDAMFVLLAGDAVVVRDGEPVARLGPGDHFGELALLDPAPRAATVTAVGPVELGAISLRMFRVLLRELPALSAKLLADLAGRVRDAG